MRFEKFKKKILLKSSVKGKIAVLILYANLIHFFFQIKYSDILIVKKPSQSSLVHFLGFIRVGYNKHTKNPLILILPGILILYGIII